MSNLDELVKLCNIPFIQDKRGKWELGDKCFCNDLGTGTVISSGHPTQIKIFFDRAELFSSDWHDREIIEAKVIWLPRLWDDVNPERGLIGMLRRTLLKNEVKVGWYGLGDNFGGDTTLVLHMPNCQEKLFTGTPTLAILKAIHAQRTVKGKLGTEPGDLCGDADCNGILDFPVVENCSCHINPPCKQCLDVKLTCNVCGREV